MGSYDAFETGTIRDVFDGTEDHGIRTIVIYIDFGGAGQGFGTYNLNNDSLYQDWLDGLTRLYNVQYLDHLKGMNVQAHREDGLIRRISPDGKVWFDGATAKLGTMQ